MESNNLVKACKIMPVIYELVNQFNCSANLNFANNKYQANLILKNRVIRFEDHDEAMLHKKLLCFLAT